MSDPYGCIVCGRVVEHPEYTLLCDACDDAQLQWANRPLPCCGHSQDYCECTPSQRDYALLQAAIERGDDGCP